MTDFLSHALSSILKSEYITVESFGILYFGVISYK